MRTKTLDLSQKAEKRYRFLAADAAHPTCLPRACGGALTQASVAVRAACLVARWPGRQAALLPRGWHGVCKHVPRDIGQTERAWGLETGNRE